MKNLKKKVTIEQMIFINSLADSIKSNYNKLCIDLENDISRLIKQVTPLLPRVHQEEDSPVAWLSNLNKDIKKNHKAIASIKVSDNKTEAVTLTVAVDMLLSLLDDHITVFGNKG